MIFVQSSARVDFSPQSAQGRIVFFSQQKRFRVQTRCPVRNYVPGPKKVETRTHTRTHAHAHTRTHTRTHTCALGCTRAHTRSAVRASRVHPRSLCLHNTSHFPQVKAHTHARTHTRTHTRAVWYRIPPAHCTSPSSCSSNKRNKRLRLEVVKMGQISHASTADRSSCETCTEGLGA